MLYLAPRRPVAGERDSHANDACDRGRAAAKRVPVAAREHGTVGILGRRLRVGWSHPELGGALRATAAGLLL
jgi:hypothetical protein